MFVHHSSGGRRRVSFALAVQVVLALAILLMAGPAAGIANAVRVTAPKEVLEKIAALPEVERIIADGRVQIPKPSPGEEKARA
jgi:hypothetical protein